MEDSVVSDQWRSRLFAALGGPPSVGIVLGSGLGDVASLLEPVGTWPYEAIAGLARPSAAGHAGRFLAGHVAGVPCLVAQGRLHLYEGHSLDTVTSIAERMLTCDLRLLILTNAAGGLHPDFQCGDVMAATDHINLMFRKPRVPQPQTVHTPVYDRALVDRAESVAVAHGFTIRRGVYAAMLGPSYETRAEYRMLRRLGADAVGMSTVPEALVARRRGVPVAALSVITNEARPDRPSRVSHEEVVDWSGRAVTRVRSVVAGLIAGAGLVTRR